MQKRKAHYCKRIADQICEHVALGLPLSMALTATGPLAPTVVTFWRWTKEYPELKADYEEALRFQANMHADRILEIGLKASKGEGAPASQRLAMDAFKWHAEMRDPQQYSPKGAQNVPIPPKNIKEMREEVDRLEKDLGIEAQPGMVTAPRVLRAKQEENSRRHSPSTEDPAPAPNPATTLQPNLKLVGDDS